MTASQVIEITDDDIVRGLLSGDEKSAGWLYKKYYKDIYYICMQKRISHEDTVELISDIFYEIILNIEKYDPQKSGLRSWVCMIAKRRAIDFIRKNSKKIEVLKDNAFWENQTFYTAAEIPADKDELFAVLNAVLQCLSDRERSVLSMVLLNHRHAEISEKLDISYSNVKTIYSRALKKARDEYNNQIMNHRAGSEGFHLSDNIRRFD